MAVSSLVQNLELDWSSEKKYIFDIQTKTMLMKKVVLFIIITFSFQLVFAQKEEWTKHFEKTKEATTIDNDFYASPDSTKIDAILEKYNEALNLLKEVENKSIEHKDAITYRRAWIYTQIAYLYQALKNNSKQEQNINKAFEYWPEFNTINQSNASKYIKFEDVNTFDNHYAKMIYLAAEAAYGNYSYETGIRLKTKLQSLKSGVNTFSEWGAYYGIARCTEAYYEDDFLYEMWGSENITEDNVFEAWIKALEVWQLMKSEDKDRNKGPFDYMIEGLNSFNTKDNSLRLRAANALYAVEKYADANKWFNSYSQSTTAAIEVGWNYSESAMKEPDKIDARNSAVILEKYSSGFSEYDWERLQKVYEFIGDNNKVQEIKNKIAEARRRAEEERRLQAQRDEEERKRREKEQRKANTRGNFSVAVSTNPFMYIWKDYPVALDIRIGRVISEFRVNFSNTIDKGDKYRFGQYKLGSSSNNATNPYKYKGMEYSYTLKILAGKMETKSVGKRKQIVGGYVGFQPRYAKYNFTSEPYTFIDSTTMIPQTFNNISASATRYEFCILGGFLGDNLGGFFHIDYYFGVGVGYRTLDIAALLPNGLPDPTFKYENYSFDDNGDKRFDPDRWNKFYVPVRFGFRIGINLL